MSTGADSPGDKPRDIGLKAIREARIERGRSKHGRISGKAWLFAISTTLMVVIVAWLFRDRSLSTQKEELLSKQRAALTTVGAEWFPLRDKMEKLTLEAAGPYKGDFIDPEAPNWDFRSLPGIYLRMRVDDAKDVAALRKKAKDSVRDAFAACLLKEKNPTAEVRARTGEADAGGPGWQDQPWNLGLAYQSTRVLTDEWVSEVNKAEDEIHLRVFVHQYEKAKDEEIPLAVDIIKRSQFFLLTLDEGAEKEEELQAKAHDVRVHLVNLKSGREMARLRLEAPGTADVRIMRNPEYNPEVHGHAGRPRIDAVQRQMTNCALAGNVLAAIKPPAP